MCLSEIRRTQNHHWIGVTQHTVNETATQRSADKLGTYLCWSPSCSEVFSDDLQLAHTPWYPCVWFPNSHVVPCTHSQTKPHAPHNFLCLSVTLNRCETSLSIFSFQYQSACCTFLFIRSRFLARTSYKWIHALHIDITTFRGYQGDHGRHVTAPVLVSHLLRGLFRWTMRHNWPTHTPSKRTVLWYAFPNSYVVL